jgi:hypothetical protein
VTSALRSRVEAYVARQLPRVLTQLDRDPDSPTFGGFDRAYWHYKVHDFASAILQQGLFTLEALRDGTLAGGPPRAAIERWCLGAVAALARRVDRAGAVDEYYPFERSYPGAAFGLYAVARVLDRWRTAAPDLLAAVDARPLARLARHVARRVEAEASNQQAAGLAGLALAARLGWLDGAAAASVEAHAPRLFAAQHAEGWFPEYGGPDCGYLSVTLDALVDYLDVTGDPRATLAIDRAVEFLALLVGADGRLPSTLNSRNTDYVVPYGLVRAGARHPGAAWLVEALFRDVDAPSHFLWATDDRYHAHYIFASVVRCLPHLGALAPAAPPAPAASTWLAGCRLWIYRPPDGSWTAYVAGSKGGLVRVHRRDGRPAVVDHGWRVYRERRVWTTNWWSAEWSVTRDEGALRIRGHCQRAAFHPPTPARHAALRVLAWLLRDRLVPLLKRVLIFRPGSADGPAFERRVEVSAGGVHVQDRLGAFAGARAAPGPRQNLRHVASADSFSAEEWEATLLAGTPLTLDAERTAEAGWTPD